ncbi:GIY-YIG nuclease family protein [Sphingopyxis macrogoltabida]|uniref:Excinuclease ABC subunit C n=1 Tax=Sphingopyxis macrogoltabida TaxID=33050 RepID=A0A0N9UV80_SPHMC|nr:GIY-YIG nuclease family protein [Sphingopyxis macrogoltabida]ALH79383.1 excinuclease ABC subunit C [Sphingopyxis macrogoltabida]
MAFWTYILLCADGRYYTGHTDNLEYRIGQHQSGAIDGFTSSRLPVRLMWSQDFATRFEALDAEMRIKKWSQAKKEALIRGDWNAVSHFAKPPAERPSPPVRVERSRDAAQDSAKPMGVSTSLDTNGTGNEVRPS